MTIDDQGSDRLGDNPDAPHPDAGGVNAKPKSNRILVVVMALGIVLAIGSSFIVRASQQAREAARRTSCNCHLKQLGLAMYNYLETYGTFPPPYTVDADGKPLHSWRTLLLPFLDQKDLYDRIDLSKPYNDPANQRVFNTAAPIFTCPSSVIDAKRTCYQVVVADESCFPPGQAITSKEIDDGLSNTILIVEAPAALSVPWMSPQDLIPDLFLNINPKTKFNHVGGFHAGMGDGSVRFIKASVPQSTLRALMTRAANDLNGDF